MAGFERPELRVILIDQHISPDSAGDNRGYDQNQRSPFSMPLISELTRLRRVFQIPTGQVIGYQLFERDFRWYIDGDPGMRVGQFADPRVGQNFEHRAGKRVGGIDDAPAW